MRLMFSRVEWGAGRVIRPHAIRVEKAKCTETITDSKTLVIILNKRYNDEKTNQKDKMNHSIAVAEINVDPLRIATTLQAPSGLPFNFRPLTAPDHHILGEYFLGLSEQTKALYGPHPFDQATADKLCAEINYADTIRFIATLPAEGQEQVIAYFILMLGLTPGEMERYPKAGIAVDPKLDCLIAPCVADAYQSQGLGSPCMRHMISVARRLGRRYFLLMGGVYAHNERAVHFYQKTGFQMVAPFTPTWAGGRLSYDMYVAL